MPLTLTDVQPQGRARRASTLVLALHSGPGDPERARREFAWLLDSGQPNTAHTELLFLGAGHSVDKQLERIAVEANGPITVAPLLLGAGFHYTNELVPAVERLAVASGTQPGTRLPGGRVPLLPQFGESAAFEAALMKAVAEFSREVPAGGVAWLVPGGPAITKRLKDALEGLKNHSGTDRDIDATITKFYAAPHHFSTGSGGKQPMDGLPRGALPIVVVLRAGNLNAKLVAEWPGDIQPRLLFSEGALRVAVENWLAE